MDRCRDYKVFLKYLLAVIAANCENSSESDKLLVNERDSECPEAGAIDSEVHKLMRLMRWDLCERLMISCIR